MSRPSMAHWRPSLVTACALLASCGGGQEPRLSDAQAASEPSMGNGARRSALAGSGLTDGPGSPELDAAVAQARQTWLKERVHATEDWHSWDGAAGKVVWHPGWKAWFEQKKQNALQWLDASPDKAEYVAGYPNGLVSPVNGSAVAWEATGLSKFDNLSANPAYADKVASYRAAWMAVNRQLTIDYTLDAARVYQVSGDTAMAERAARQLDFYADNYLQWPLRQAIGDARMFGQSLDEAMSVLSLLEAARALGTYASADRRARWRTGLFMPMAPNLRSYAWGPLNNINLWCAVARAAIGLELGSSAADQPVGPSLKTWGDELVADAVYGDKGIVPTLNVGATRDGIWAEGTFTYNNFVLLALARLFDFAAAAGRYEYVDSFAPDVQRMLVAPTLYRFNDGTNFVDAAMPNPSDSRAAPNPIDRATHAALYRHVPTQFGLRRAAEIYSWAALSDEPKPASQPPSLGPVPRSILAPQVKFAMTRVGPWQLFVHYGQGAMAHAQQEALTYELVHAGTSITRDAGTATDYGTPEHQQYFSQGIGNNTPLVNGQGQQGWAPGSVTLADLDNGRLDVAQPDYRSDASATRSFTVSPDMFSETTTLTLKGVATPQRLGVVFNTGCQVQLTPSPPLVSVPNPEVDIGGTGFRFWTGTVRQGSRDQPILSRWWGQLNCAGKRYAMTVVGSPGFVVAYQGTVPDTPLPAKRSGIYVETLGTQASFTTSIVPLPN